MSEQATDGEQALWDAVYLDVLRTQLSGKERLSDTGAQWVADKAVERRRESIAARSPEPESTKPAKVKRAPALLRSACPGSGSPLVERGDRPCPKCKRLVGALPGRGGWYMARHKLPAEVGK